MIAQIGLVERLRGRRVTRWVHATGETPHASGYALDELCAEAADLIESLNLEVDRLRADRDLVTHKCKADALTEGRRVLLEVHT